MSELGAWPCVVSVMVGGGRWMSSVRAWCMAMCCVCDGRWRQWRVVSELGAWPCVVSVMVGGGSG